MAVPNSNFANDLIAATLRRYDKMLQSTILDQTNALAAMKQRSVEVRGGRELAFPVIYDDNDTFKAYERDDDIDLSEQDGLSHSTYEWRQYAGSIVIPNIDLFKNGSDKEKIVDLLDYKVQQLKESIAYKLTTDLFAAQSGKKILGLPDLIASSNNTVGGINSSTHSWWRNQKATTATFGTTINGNGFVYMNNIMRAASPMGKAPDLILTSSFLYGAIEQALMAARSLDGNRPNPDWGFDHIPFKGSSIVFDGQCSTGHLYFVNTDKIKLILGEGAKFALDEKVAPANKDISVWVYKTYLAHVAKERRSSAQLYGITST